MKPLFTILVICGVGYIASHWEDIREQHTLFPTPHLPGLIIYETRSSPECIRLLGQLTRQDIAYQKRDMDDEANQRELTEKLARVGRAGGNITLPVADIDGALVSNATIDEVVKRWLK